MVEPELTAFSPSTVSSSDAELCEQDKLEGAFWSPLQVGLFEVIILLGLSLSGFQSGNLTMICPLEGSGLFRVSEKLTSTFEAPIWLDSGVT